MKECKICGGKKQVSFLASYDNKKVFESMCNDCKNNYIFFIERNKDGTKKYYRTLD